MSEQSLYAFSSVSRAPSLSDRVVEQLTDAIVQEKIRAGERLPSERDLGDKFKVSRTVVREAVRSLAARGLVRVRSGRGLEVSGSGPGNVAALMSPIVRGYGRVDYRKVHEMRTAVEVQVAGLAAERATKGDVELLCRICDEHQRSLEQGDLDNASELDFQFHRELTKAADNELLLAMLDSISDVLRELRRQSAKSDPHVSNDGLRAHRQVLKWVEEKKPEKARNAMIKHLTEAERVWLGSRAGGSKSRVHRAIRSGQ